MFPGYSVQLAYKRIKGTDTFRSPDNLFSTSEKLSHERTNSGLIVRPHGLGFVRGIIYSAGTKIIPCPSWTIIKPDFQQKVNQYDWFWCSLEAVVHPQELLVKYLTNCQQYITPYRKNTHFWLVHAPCRKSTHFWLVHTACRKSNQFYNGWFIMF